MTLTIDTSVKANAEYVWGYFNETLFKKLSPPFPITTLVRYDGNNIGDLVIIDLNFLLFKQRWISKITENARSGKGYYFVDIGEKLPFFLGTWSHKHMILENGENTIIRDQISFEAPLPIFSFLVYPLIWGQFMMRKPIYKKVFS